MKKPIFIISILLSFLILVGCNNDDNPFLGKWQVVSIIDGEVITDCSNENRIRAFSLDGRLGGFEQKVTYSFNEQNLFYRFNSGIIHTYIYSFSDDNQTLRIELVHIKNEGDIMYFHLPDFQMIGKTQVYKRITK